MARARRLKPLSHYWKKVRSKAKTMTWSQGRSIVGGTIDAAVMFIDLREFTARCWRHRQYPEAAAILAHEGAALLEEWCGGMPSLSRAFVDKIIGDAVMLVVPGPRVRAMKDALWIAHGVLFRNDFPCRLGVHWGRVFLGEIGLGGASGRARVGALTVAGHVVNIASRLQGKADEREICVLGQPLGNEPAPLERIDLRRKKLRHFTRWSGKHDLKGYGKLRVLHLRGGGLLADPDDASDPTERDLLMALCQVQPVPRLD